MYNATKWSQLMKQSIASPAIKAAQNQLSDFQGEAHVSSPIWVDHVNGRDSNNTDADTTGWSSKLLISCQNKVSHLRDQESVRARSFCGFERRNGWNRCQPYHHQTVQWHHVERYQWEGRSSGQPHHEPFLHVHLDAQDRPHARVWKKNKHLRQCHAIVRF